MIITKFFKKKPFIIAGPCSAESESQVLAIANQIKDYTNLFRAGLWKPRTSPNSFEGVGNRGLKWLQKVREKTGLKVATEVATAKHVEYCLKAEIDMLWIGARTTVNPFYIQEIAEALKGVDIPVLVKNPVHPEIGLWVGALERLNKVGITKLAAIHRGFHSYKKSVYRNDPKWDMPIKLRERLIDMPIICDPSHIAGKSELIEDIAQTAMDINLDGLMIETHLEPKKALSDSNQQILPLELNSMLQNLILRSNKLRDQKFRNELRAFRDKIDVLDEEIIDLFRKRKQIVEQIAILKDQNKLTIFQIERWFEILKTRKKYANSLNLHDEFITEIFDLIHKYSILVQTKKMRQ
tara:strand:+ start:240 stop:1295 length:1056 start_codon:yes stop_codon:yes gene_type:complete